MDLRYSDVDEAFRARLREWLSSELPKLPVQPARDDWSARRGWDTDWQRRLFDAGYAGINWPKEFMCIAWLSEQLKVKPHKKQKN